MLAWPLQRLIKLGARKAQDEVCNEPQAEGQACQNYHVGPHRQLLQVVEVPGTGYDEFIVKMSNVDSMGMYGLGCLGFDKRTRAMNASTQSAIIYQTNTVLEVVN